MRISWLCFALVVPLAVANCLAQQPPEEETTIARDDALRTELLEMQEVDQQARRAFLQAQDDTELMDRIAAIDKAHVARMKVIIKQRGWPGRSLVGYDGAHAAWLLVQHSDVDREFQTLCLRLMKAAVAQGEAAAKDWAYLVDRVRVSRQQPQVYGTQFMESADGGFEPQPIEDAKHVDERRKSVGLVSLAEYKQQMQAFYGKQPAATRK